MKRQYLAIVFSIFWIFLSCEDFLDKEPVDSLTDESAIIDVSSAQGAVAALYHTFAPGDVNPNLSDEINGNPGDDVFTLHAVDPSHTAWGFTSILRANNIIEKVPSIDVFTSDQEDLMKQFVAEAKCIRALTYLKSMTAWGDYPWSESTDFRELQSLPRTPKVEIYNNIIEDIIEAKEVLPESYGSPAETRTRFTKGAATALLARTYIYQGDWEKAEAEASEVIDNSLYKLAPDYSNVFIKNSEESILELWSDRFTHSGVGFGFFPRSLGGLYGRVPTEDMVNAFEVGDLRKPVAVAIDADGLVYVNKYQDVAFTGTLQEIKVFRLAEMYLIRAEARAQQDNVIGALNDLNTIRNRAGLPEASASTTQEALTIIERERFVELCFEGHRWFDLVRTGRIDEIMNAFSPETWQPRLKLMPVPQSELELNPNLTQNPGY